MRIRVKLSLDIPIENGAWKLSPAIELEEEVSPEKDLKDAYLDLYSRAQFMFWKSVLTHSQMREQILLKGLESATQENLEKTPE